MKIAITLTIDQRAKHKSYIISDMSNKLAIYFRDKDYGLDIQDYIIGCICTLPPEGFEKFNIPHKPVYVDDKTTKNRFTGENQRMYKLFINEFNFNAEEYEEFISVSEEESKRVLTTKIIDSLKNLDLLPKKVKNFDKENFKNDLLIFFNAEK